MKNGGGTRMWLESMYGTRLPAAAARHGDELDRWVHKLEERRGGQQPEWMAMVFPGLPRRFAGDQACVRGEFDADQ